MIYIITDVFRIGDAATNRIVAYSNALTNKGLNVSIIALASTPISISHLVENVEVRFLCDYYISNPILRYLVCLKKLRGIVHSMDNQDVVIAYNSMNYLPFILAWKRKLVFHERTEYPGMDRLLFPKSLYYYFCRKCTGMFVISSSLYQHFNSKKIKNIVVVNMVVDKSRFLNVSQCVETASDITYCGSLGNSKDGLDILIKVFAKYHKFYPDRRLNLIGPISNNSTYHEIIKLINDEDLNDFVKIWGLVSNDLIPDILCRSEMLVLTRPKNLQAKYGFPTKLGEYLLSERPVIVTNVGDISLFLTHKKNAFVVSPDEPDEILESMLFVSEHPELSNRIAKEGREAALRYFDCDKEINKLIQVIDEVIVNRNM